MKNSILFILAGDRNKASSRVRGFWIAEALEKLGFNCTVRWKHGRRAILSLLPDILKHDVLVFQKTYSRYHRWLMVVANVLGKRTYLDIDDAPSRTNSPVTLRNFHSMLLASTGVFAGSTNLLQYVRQYQPRSYLIPSSINLRHYMLLRSQISGGKVCLGWIGNGKHYERDLIEILIEPLKELSAIHPLRFKIVGARGVNALYETFAAIPNLQIDFVDSLEWSNPQLVARTIEDFDIGLYPLLSNEFNRYKCGFKALEYMAMSIPVVASPVSVNMDIIENGVEGYLAGTKDEWIKGLRDLIEQPERRIQMGNLGRSTVEAQFNVVSTAINIGQIIQRP